MKIILIGLLTLGSITAFAETRFYDCEYDKGSKEKNARLYAHRDGTATEVYNFGGAIPACQSIASKLNIQIISKGLAEYYDCEDPTYNQRHNKIVSNLGVVISTEWNNFTCTILVNNLNKNLR